MKRALIAALMVIALPGTSVPQRSVVIHNGWLKAQSYLDMDPASQKAYVMGALDGMYNAPYFGAAENDKILMRIEKCVESTSNASQVAAIVLKGTKEHPERWSWDLITATIQAILDVCPAQPALKK